MAGMQELVARVEDICEANTEDFHGSLSQTLQSRLELRVV